MGQEALKQEEIQSDDVKESHLRHLESVGQLASGIAHEINTPIQFIGDSVQFLSEAFHDILAVTKGYERFLAKVGETHADVFADEIETLNEIIEDADFDYLAEHVPSAFTRTLSGVERVTEIVRAMKVFAHHDRGRRKPCDINQMLDSALIVARNEYKYIAKIEKQLGHLPTVVCCESEINQVFLNLIVNASHAIQDRYGASQGIVGLIGIRTEYVDAQKIVQISIQDNGCGIPEDIRSKVYDPFFTTKEVGRGTGQGLSIIHGIINAHGGQIKFSSQVNQGTCFTVELPIGEVAEDAE